MRWRAISKGVLTTSPLSSLLEDEEEEEEAVALTLALTLALALALTEVSRHRAERILPVHGKPRRN